MNLVPFRFRKLKQYIHASNVKILDVGAGSHSASITKKWYPESEYHGIDRTQEYQNDANDIQLMDKFYEMDVTELDFSSIPDRYFDVIIMSHIIEHLHNGDLVIKGLVSKLIQGGKIYIEFPSTRSVTLPSMKGTLNFYDDETHCRLYTRPEVEKILTKNGCRVVHSAVRKDWIRIMNIPLLAINSKIKYGYVVGSVYWDLMGFAEFVLAEKI